MKGTGPDAIVRLAEGAQALHGFNDFKLRGGVLRRRPGQAVTATKRFPELALRSTQQRLAAEGRRTPDARPARRGRLRRGPCGAETASSGREGDGQFRRATGLPTATNADRHRLAPAPATRCPCRRGHPADRAGPW